MISKDRAKFVESILGITPTVDAFAGDDLVAPFSKAPKYYAPIPELGTGKNCIGIDFMAAIKTVSKAELY